MSDSLIRTIEVLLGLAGFAIGTLWVRKATKDETSRKLRADLYEADRLYWELRRKFAQVVDWITKHMRSEHGERFDPDNIPGDE